MSMERVTTLLIDVMTQWGLKVVGVLVILFAAWIIGGWSRKRLKAIFAKKNFDSTLSSFFSNLVRYAIIIGAVLGCLGVFGIQTASFAAVIAAAGLAVGLAFQGTLSNFAAGVMLLVFRPFKVGDWVKVDGEIGAVKEIELFTSHISTPDNRLIIIPNSKVFGSKIENITFFEKRRVDIPVGVDYSADVDETRKALDVAVKNVEKQIEEPAPQVFLKELGDSSVNWIVRVWCKTEDYWDVYQSIIRECKNALDAAEIGIPFPQMDVHLDDPVIKAMGNR